MGGGGVEKIMKGCDSSSVCQKSKKKHDYKIWQVLSKMNFFVVMFVFAEQRSVQSEHQNPVFHRNRFSGSNFVTNEFFGPRKSLEDGKFCVDSKCAVKNIVSLRNLEKILKNREIFFVAFVVFLRTCRHEILKN